MKYLIPVKSEEDFADALEATKIFPDFIAVHQRLYFQKTNPEPNSEIGCYYYEDGFSKDRIYMVGKKTKSEKTFSYFLILNSKLNAKFKKEFFFEALDELRNSSPSWFGTVGAGMLCCDPLTDLLQEWLKSRITDFAVSKSPGYFYYMTEDQKKNLLNLTKNGLPLAEGYVFEKADPEKDGKKINDTWIHSEPENLEATKYKLSHLPHSLIRLKSTGEAVSYEMSESGFIHHLFTMPDHRRKGLGDAVEKDICTKVIKTGYTPYKGVELFNKSVITSSDKSEFWTRVDSDDGSPMVYTFHFLELPKLQ